MLRLLQRAPRDYYLINAEDSTWEIERYRKHLPFIQVSLGFEDSFVHRSRFAEPRSPGCLPFQLCHHSVSLLGCRRCNPRHYVLNMYAQAVRKVMPLPSSRSGPFNVHQVNPSLTGVSYSIFFGTHGSYIRIISHSKGFFEQVGTLRGGWGLQGYFY